MKVLPIQQTYFTNSLKLKNDETKPINNEPVCTPELSIYSKGTSAINFGHIITQKAITSFEKEIAEQPDVISKLIHKYFGVWKINMDLNMTPDEVQKLQRINIFASGSSRNAAEMAQGFIEKVTKMPVFVYSASEAMSNMKPINPKEDLAIFVSQSGGTADTYAVLQIAKNAGLKTFAITNNHNSKIAKAVDTHIYLEAGEEKAVAATKTVTSSIFNLLLVGMKLGEIKHVLNKSEMDNLQTKFRNLPLAMKYMLQRDYDVKKAAEVISQADNIYYYAKGDSVGAAKEGALKLTETTGKRVIADASGEALHGTFASIKPDDVVLQIINFETGRYSKENIEEIVKKRHVKNPIIMQAIDRDKDLCFENGVQPIYLEYPYVYGIHESASPILATIKFQQITNEVTKILGINPDNGGGFLTKFRQNISM